MRILIGLGASRHLLTSGGPTTENEEPRFAPGLSFWEQRNCLSHRARGRRAYQDRLPSSTGAVFGRQASRPASPLRPRSTGEDVDRPIPGRPVPARLFSQLGVARLPKLLVIECVCRPRPSGTNHTLGTRFEGRLSTLLRTFASVRTAQRAEAPVLGPIASTADKKGPALD
jgi:hypothetical protein